MSVVHRGSNNVQGAVKFSFSQTEGNSITRTFQGTEAQMTLLYNDYKGDGWSCELEEGPFWTLRVRNPSDTTIEEEVPVLSYELVPNKIEKDLLNSSLPIIQNLSTYDAGVLKLYNAQPDKFVDGTPPVTTANAVAIYAHLKEGMRNIPIHQPILRTSYVCSVNYNVTAHTANNGYILSTNSLVAQEEIPLAISNLMPNSGIEPARSLDKVPAFYGWYQNPPSVQQASANRLTVSQNWEFGLWPEFIYGQPI